jgi:hypothetical protein
MNLEDMPPHPRKKPLFLLELPAKLNVNLAQARNETNMRRYCWEKGVCLPDAIQIEASATDDGWRIVVWEDPDTDPPREITSGD